MKLIHNDKTIILDDHGQDLEMLRHIVTEYYDTLTSCANFKQTSDPEQLKEAVRVALVGHQLGIDKFKLPVEKDE